MRNSFSLGIADTNKIRPESAKEFKNKEISNKNNHVIKSGESVKNTKEGGTNNFKEVIK